MILGVVRESDEFDESSPPNSALVIRPDPWGRGGASLAALAGFGDGAVDDGAVVLPFSFLPDGLFTAAIPSFESTSIASDCGCGRDGVALAGGFGWGSCWGWGWG